MSFSYVDFSNHKFGVKTPSLKSALNINFVGLHRGTQLVTGANYSSAYFREKIFLTARRIPYIGSLINKYAVV